MNMDEHIELSVSAPLNDSEIIEPHVCDRGEIALFAGVTLYNGCS